MRMLDCHVHWFPRSVFDDLCERKTGTYPRAERNDVGGYEILATYGRVGVVGYRRKYWFDLDDHLRHFDQHNMDFILSLGPFSTFFSEIPLADGIHYSRMYNDEMAAAQRKHAGRVWASGVVPLQDTQAAIDELDRSITKLGLIGVNIPGSIGRDSHIDAPRLEPFYARVEQLGIPIFIHPTDNTFIDIMDGYNGALHLALGRTFDVSTTAARLIFSGLMERHPKLKVYMSHTGGALPFQAGRMDKSAYPAGLPQDASVYLKRFLTDTVSPHAAGVKFAIEFFGVDHIMFGDDYPCWKTETALEVLDGVSGLSQADKEKILGGNARRFFGLPEPVQAAKPAVPAFA
jgi:aminocarboxymuconate-semialdehyde decarboxylase